MIVWRQGNYTRYEYTIVGFIESVHVQQSQMSRRMTKPTKWPVRAAKTQIRLGITPVWSEASLCAQWVGKEPNALHADIEDSDQTGRMPRLILVFAGCTCYFVGFVMRRLKWDGAVTPSSRAFGQYWIPETTHNELIDPTATENIISTVISTRRWFRAAAYALKANQISVNAPRM